MWKNYFRVSEKAVSLANAIGGQALRLADLETFRPEEGMILANATSLGMQPNIDGTPIPKVAPQTSSLSLSLSLTNTHTIGGHCFLSQNDHRNLLVSLSVFVFQE